MVRVVTIKVTVQGKGEDRVVLWDKIQERITRYFGETAQVVSMTTDEPEDLDDLLMAQACKVG